ncbi:MAG TPA: hypothetical protein VGK21_11775, partial [Candidatus Angelobacter sp.]
MYAQSTHANSTSKTTSNTVFETPAAGADSSADPRVIRYDGVLKGQPSSTGVAVIFSIYGSGDSTNPLWQETQTVQPGQDGRYTVFLGASASGGLPSLVFAESQPRWLGVRVAGEDNEQRTLVVTILNDGKALTGSVASAAKAIENSSPTLIQQKSSVQQPGALGLAIGTSSSFSLPSLPLGAGSTGPIVSHEVIANSSTDAFTVRQDGSGIGAHITAQTNNALLAETTSTSAAQTTILSINRAPEGTGLRAESQASTGSGSGVWGISASDGGIGILGVSRSPSG